MKKRVLAACAFVCTISVLSMICLGQIKKNRSISPLAAANVEALTDLESELQDENCLSLSGYYCRVFSVDQNNNVVYYAYDGMILKELVEEL